MRNSETLLPQDIYEAHLKTINNIKFTRREIDVISFFIHGRSPKKIASFLSIAPKTIENHTRNIMLKLECNSRESIIDFIEKSYKLQPLRSYYSSLLIQSAFEEVLQKASVLIKREASSCHIIYGGEKETQDPWF